MQTLLRPFSKSTLLLAAAAIIAITTGCGPPWRVIKQANPNPMMGQKNFVVDNIHFENLKVGKKTVQEYLAGKEQKTQDSFQADLLDGNKIFQGSVIERSGALQVSMNTAPQPGSFFVKPTVDLYEPGNFNGFVNIPTNVNMRLEILNDQGAALDEISLAWSEPATLYNPASGTRFRQSVKQLGYIAARYLAERSGTAPTKR
jgi:hypothetical protein